MSYFNNGISKLLLNSLAISVLPVPVGPKNKNEAIGAVSLLMPANDTYSLSNTLSITSSCPNNLFLMLSSSFLICVFCSCFNLSNGTLAILATCSSTRSLLIVIPFKLPALALAQAASIKSMLLSGFFLSCMNLSPILTAVLMASASTLTS